MGAGFGPHEYVLLQDDDVDQLLYSHAYDRFCKFVPHF